MGIDYSTRFVDCVTVPFEGSGVPVWHRFELVGNDAFDRTRSVADSMPGRSSVFFEDILAVGIEHPGGNHGTGALLRVQGAILARIPARMLVHPLPPGKWRKLVELPGNATKADVMRHSTSQLYPSAKTSPFLLGLTGPDGEWPQDAHDAHLIALATRSLIDTKQAA